MDLKSLFTQAVAESKDLPDRPTNETLLQLYALYKQATEGDIHGETPSMYDFVAKAKYEAWSSLQGNSQEMAMQDYVSLVQKLKS